MPCIHTPRTNGANWLGLGENTTIQLKGFFIYKLYCQVWM